MISEAEAFLQETLVEIIYRHSEKIGKEQIVLKEIAKHSSIKFVVWFAAEKYANQIMCGKLAEYRTNIGKLISLDTTLLNKLWPVYIEAKAQRDLGVHNGWKFNDIYRNKVKDAGLEVSEKEYVSVDFDCFL